MAKHPMQPVEMVGQVVRFKQNKIIRYLIDCGSIDLNDIARQQFSEEDQMQLSQLLGYSVSGYGGLSYASKKSIRKADKRAAKLLRKRQEK